MTDDAGHDSTALSCATTNYKWHNYKLFVYTPPHTLPAEAVFEPLKSVATKVLPWTYGSASVRSLVDRSRCSAK